MSEITKALAISVQADLQAAAEILEALSGRLDDAEYAAPGGMVYVGYVEADRLKRSQAQAKVLRGIIARAALSSASPSYDEGIEAAAKVASKLYNERGDIIADEIRALSASPPSGERGSIVGSATDIVAWLKTRKRPLGKEMVPDEHSLIIAALIERGEHLPPVGGGGR